MNKMNVVEPYYNRARLGSTTKGCQELFFDGPEQRDKEVALQSMAHAVVKTRDAALAGRF